MIRFAMCLVIALLVAALFAKQAEQRERVVVVETCP